MRYRLTLAAAAGTALASTALYVLFDGLAWFWAGVGAIALVAGIGMATRLRPLPVIACVLADLAGLVLYLNVLFASARSWLVVVPNLSSLSYLAQLTTQGMTDADRFSPPVPLTPGLMLLSTAGIGLAALATDTVAVRLRSSAVAGLALLALFIVPSTTPAARSGLGTTIVFCLGTCGYLLILAADGREQIRRWGRTVSLWRADAYSRNGLSRAPGRPRTSEIRALSSAGRRVGVASIVVALCVPLFVPGLRVNRMFPAHVNIFGPAASALGGNGSGVPNPLAVMSQDLREAQPSVVLTYHSTDPQPQYLQMYTLGDLSTTAWTMGPFQGATTTVTGKLAPPQGLTDADRTTVTTHVAISKGAASATSGMSFLPVPYPATAISVPGHWVNNVGTSMVVGFDTSLSGLGYTVTSDDIDPTVKQLTRAPAPPAAIADEYLNVPSAFRSLTALARKVTANAATPYAKAIALQKWFADSGQFTYSLSATEPPDASGLSHFLTVSRRGYCQQFAFAMAVLARLLGIPSRVAIGFTAGTPTGINTWEVKTSDAHAWPELYFQGAGWLRFEPTPTGSAGQGTATPPTYTVSPTDPGAGSPVTSPAVGQPGTGTSGTKGGGANYKAGSNRFTAEGTGSGAVTAGTGFPWGPLGFAVLALLAVVAVAPRAARSVRRQSRLLRGGEADRTHAIWREVLDDLADYRVGPRPNESPRAVARRVTNEACLTPPAAAALSRAALAEERARYASTPSADQPSRGDLDVIRRGLAASADRGTRWRAWLFPASAFPPVRAGFAQLADAAARAPSGRWRPRLWRRDPLNDPGPG
jgi:transglutaminase-like putative cysteine protease